MLYLHHHLNLIKIFKHMIFLMILDIYTQLFSFYFHDFIIFIYLLLYKVMINTIIFLIYELFLTIFSDNYNYIFLSLIFVKIKSYIL